MSFAHHGDVEIFYETFGEPSDPALLLVNGLGSQCINYRVEWCEKFAAEGFFVIRFDNRDVGLSTKFSDVAPAVGAVVRALSAGHRPEVPYTLDDMAGDSVAVLDHLGIDKSHVMGVSMGGMIVQQLAIAHSERLFSVTSVMSTTGDPAVGRSSLEAQALLLGAPPTDRASAIGRHLEGIRTYGSPAFYDEERLTEVAAEAYDRCFCPDGQARQVMAIITSPDRTSALHDVRVPTLVMHGDADTLVDISGGRSTADAIPGARFVVMEGMGHDYPPQYWDRWVHLVTDHARAAGEQ